MRVPRPGRAGQDVRARAEARRLPTWWSCRAHSGRRHLLVVRRRAAVPGERLHRWWPSRCPDIDAILVGHAHVEIPAALRHERADRQAGAAVRAALLGHAGVGHGPRPRAGGSGRWTRRGPPTPTLLNSNTVARGPRGGRGCCARHDKVVAVRQLRRSARPTQAMSAASAPVVEDVAGDRLHQLRAGRRGPKALTGTADAALPVLSIAAPVQPRRGDPRRATSRVRDVAGLYIYDNTLLGVKVTGAQVQGLPGVLRALLQAGHRRRARSPPDDVTNAPDRDRAERHAGLQLRHRRPASTPPLTYDIDIAQAAGSRIRNLTYGGAPVAADQQFVMAINNYRQSGGGNFPRVTTAPVRLQPRRSRSGSCSSTGSPRPTRSTHASSPPTTGDSRPTAPRSP